MISLELSDIEREKLTNVLNHYLSELRMEIADTNSSFFKDELKTEKDLLIGILKRLDNSLKQVS